ncbi:hypothetical protein NGRA_3470 [Nosema granulosis]|uniref:Uncharacterized protein n=1 Tax=Nosema granulosis TaxID=83296 RepID=A0A9P6GW49_9MICR|nr:hypothetical protein NGRA_3470 [Nosema granulosis]
MLLLFFISQIICDNIEIDLKDFDEVTVNNNVIRSSDLNGYTSIKISHPGTSIYKLVKTGNRKFKLIDVTRYFDKKYERKIRVDFEDRSHGVLLGQGIMIVLTSLVALCFLFVFKNIFGVFKI